MRTFTLTALAAALALAPALAMAAPPGVATADSAHSSAAATATPGAPPAVAADDAGHSTGAIARGDQVPVGMAQLPDTEIPPPDQGFLSRTSQLDREIQILERQAKIADLQKKIAGADTPAPPPTPTLVSTPPADLGGKGATTTAVSSAVVAPPAHKAPKSLRLVGVAEIGRAAQATIIDRGIPVQVQVGSALPSGWRVVAITSTSATLARGRARRSLTIGD